MSGGWQERAAIALAHHRQGRTVEAQRLYRILIAEQPQCDETLHRLGVLRCQSGETDGGIRLIRRAILIRRVPAYHVNIGTALKGLGQSDAALAAFRAAIALEPNHPQAQNTLGAALKDLGRPEMAMAAYRIALRLAPDYPEALSNMGNALTRLGRLDEAANAFRVAISLRPGYPEAHVNLGGALTELARLDGAVAAYRTAIVLKSDVPEAHYNLGNAHQAAERRPEAIASYRRAVTLRPDYAEALNNLGAALEGAQRPIEAATACRSAVRLRPDDPEARYNLGIVLQDLKRPTEAITAYRSALDLQPNLPDALYNLGNALKDQGRLSEALAAYRTAIRLRPEYTEALNHAIYLRRHACDWAEFDAEEALLIEHARAQPDRITPFSLLCASSTPADQLACATAKRLRGPSTRTFASAPSHASGKIRLGYLSADFHQHAIPYLIAELFERHDRTQFEVFGYSYGPDDGSPIRRRLIPTAPEGFH